MFFIHSHFPLTFHSSFIPPPYHLIYIIYFNDGSSSLACLHHRCEGMCLNGGIGRRSLDADTLKTTTESPKIMSPATAVLRFHAGGFGHQPPDGVQTCVESKESNERFCSKRLKCGFSLSFCNTNAPSFPHITTALKIVPLEHKTSHHLPL